MKINLIPLLRDDISVEDFVIQEKQRSKNVWLDKDHNYWFMRLVQEVGELGSSLAGDHDDLPEHELVQIATIAMNWLEYRLNEKYDGS